MMRVFAGIGVLYVLSVLGMSALVAASLLWERLDRRARDREQSEQDQMLHISKFSRVRAAGTYRLAHQARSSRRPISG